MKFCATALHREMRLLAAERFASTTFPNQKKKKKEEEILSVFHTRFQKSSFALFIINTIFKSPECVLLFTAFCKSAGFHLPAEAGAFLDLSHVSTRKRKIASGEEDNTWQELSLTWRGTSALCHIAKGLFKN